MKKFDVAPVKETLTKGSRGEIRDLIASWIRGHGDTHTVDIVEPFFAAIRLRTMNTKEIGEFLGTEEAYVNHILKKYIKAGITPAMLLTGIIDCLKDKRGDGAMIVAMWSLASTDERVRVVNDRGYTAYEMLKK